MRHTSGLWLSRGHLLLDHHEDARSGYREQPLSVTDTRRPNTTREGGAIGSGVLGWKGGIS